MKNLVILFLLLFFSLLKSQESIETDRPDQTESPSITPKKHLQIEVGLLYEKTDDNFQNISHPTILWKYGVNENFELRLETEFITEKFQEEKVSGIAPITFGFKSKLVEEKKWIPDVSFLGHLTTSNWGSKDFQTPYLAPSFRFLFNHSLSEKLSLGYNFGTEWNGETSGATGIYTLSAAYSFTEKLGGFAEIYGFLNKYTSADHRLDAGFTYLLNDNFQFDASSGIGLSKNAPDYFLSCGVSYRINTAKK